MPRTIQRDEIPFAIAVGGLLAIYGLLIAGGFKQFSIWQQVLDLRLHHPVDLIREFHPHALRLTVVLPYLLLADATGLSADWLFSVAIGAAMIATGLLSGWLLSALAFGGRNRFRCLLLTSVPILTLSLAMNGRIAFAMAGITLIAFQQTFWLMGKHAPFGCPPIWQLAGLWLASVSSGTLMVAFLLVLIGNGLVVLSDYPKLAGRNLPALVVFNFALLLGTPMVIVGLQKNLRFFGGGIEGFFAMLRHGAGKIMPPDFVLFTLSLTAFAAGGWMIAREVMRLVRSRGSEGPLYLTILLGLAGGAFGFSTLACAVPLYLVGFYLWFWGPHPQTRSVAA